MGAMRRVALLLYTLALLMGLQRASANETTQRSPPSSPTQHWQPHPAAQSSADCRRDLDDVSRYLKRLDTTSLMAAKDGMALFTYGPVAETSIVFSVRKSILAMLYGNYVEQGQIDLNATLGGLDVDDIGGLLPPERAARVVDLLESRSGVFHPAANSGDDLAQAPARGSQPPGAYFLYNNWDFNAAGTAFERLTGVGIYDAFLQDIARPIQLEDYEHRRHRKMGDRSKSQHLAYPFYLSARDMARIGQLMLRNGDWNGQPVMSPAWTRSIVALRTPAADMHPPATARRGLGYGRMWWLIETPPPSPLAGAYMAWGVHGQFILVIPGRNMVIAHKRRVPVGTNWNVSWVRVTDFFKAAEQLASARCG